MLEIVPVVALLVLVLLVSRLAPHESGSGQAADNGDEPGGGGGTLPDAGSPNRNEPQGAGPTDEPAWWPEFEREFAAYVARRGLLDLDDQSRPDTPSGRDHL